MQTWSNLKQERLDVARVSLFSPYFTLATGCKASGVFKKLWIFKIGSQLAELRAFEVVLTLGVLTVWCLGVIARQSVSLSMTLTGQAAAAYMQLEWARWVAYTHTHTGRGFICLLCSRLNTLTHKLRRKAQIISALYCGLDGIFSNSAAKSYWNYKWYEQATNLFALVNLLLNSLLITFIHQLSRPM